MMCTSRPIRSFVRREGRMTIGQKKAFENHWGRYGVDIEAGKTLDLFCLFGRGAPVWLEIGFGNGEALISMAQRHPEINLLGVEVYRPGVGHLLYQAAELALSNIRVICDNAATVFEHAIPDQSLGRVLLFFPDPWPKMRHHKRRLMQPEFARLVRAKLKSGAVFHMATDWEDYAHFVLAVMSKTPGFENLAGQGRFAERPDYRAATKFERRGLRMGYGVWDLLFRRG
jgi:tRNA (guanine-N7-)-methyltransferase